MTEQQNPPRKYLPAADILELLHNTNKQITTNQDLTKEEPLTMEAK